MAQTQKRMNPRHAKSEVDDSKPRYELTEQSYLGDVLYEEGAEVVFEGVPGPHMIPLNEAAEKMCEEHSKAMQVVDPIQALTVVGEGATVLQAVHNQG